MDLPGLGRRLLPGAVQPMARRQMVSYRSLGLRTQDVMLVSYPKSGSTWLRFLLAHALTGTEADFDSIRETIPPLGRQRRAPALLPHGGRLIRSHEPLRPPRRHPQPRLVYLVRDGRSVALSYFHHHRREGRHTTDLTEYLDAFLQGRLDGYGPWPQHVLSALRAPGRELLLVRYEDLRGDTEAELWRVLAFLGRDADRGRVGAVVAANDKERMRAKEATSTFLARRPTDGSPLVRPDRVPGWTELLPVDGRRRFEAECRDALEAAGYPLDRPPEPSPSTS